MRVAGDRDIDMADIIETATITVTESGEITAWDASAERLFGLDAASARGRHLDELLDEGTTASTELAREAGQGRALTIETIVRTPDGGHIPIILTAQAASGNGIQLTVIKNPAFTGPEEAARLAAIVESSDDAIVSKDLDGIVLSWNRAAEHIFGYTAEEMIGTSIRRIIPDDRQAEEDATLATIRRGGKVDHFETIRRRKSGELIPISLTVSPIQSETGEIVGASKIARDVSALRQAERARIRALEETVTVTEALIKVGAAVASDLDRASMVQAVTDAATEMTTAEFGAFFYNVLDAAGQSYMLYTISGVPREAFSQFPMPRNTEVFEPTFKGTGVVRSPDITADPRYGHNPPYQGMPRGHLPVRSYLAFP